MPPSAGRWWQHAALVSPLPQSHSSYAPHSSWKSGEASVRLQPHLAALKVFHRHGHVTKKRDHEVQVVVEALTWTVGQGPGGGKR